MHISFLQVSPTLEPTIGPTAPEPTINPTLAPTMNPTTPEPTRGGVLFPTTNEPTQAPNEYTGKPDGGWSPPHGPPAPDGGWSPSHDDHPDGWKSSQAPIAWKNDSWGGKGGKSSSKSAKAKSTKSFSRPQRWIPASGGDWLSYGWHTTGWGSDGHSEDFSWGGKWGRNDSTSSDGTFKWDRPMQGKASKSKSKSSKKGGSWDSAVSMSYSNDDGWWNADDDSVQWDSPIQAKSSKSKSNDWWKPSTWSTDDSLPGGLWVDPAWQVSKGSDSSSSSSSQGHQSSISSGGHNSSSKPISSKSQNGHHAGQSGKGHKKSSSGKEEGDDSASHKYSPTESIQSTKSAKSATVKIERSPPNSYDQSEEISMEDYNKMKYWAEKKWQNKKQSSGSSSCLLASRFFLLASTLAMPIVLGFTLW